MGWNGSSSAGQPANGRAGAPRPPQKKSPSLARGLLAGVLVVVLAGGAALWFFTRPAPKAAPQLKSSSKPASIKEVTPAPAPKTPEELVRELPEKEPNLKDGQRVAKPRERAAIKPLKGPAKWLKDARDRGERPIFEYEVENFLATYAVSGEEVPPVPIDDGMKQSFVESLLTPIVISENDPPAVVQKKEMVAAMKEEMKAYIKDGGTFEGYFKELEKRQAHEVNIKNDAQTMFTQMLDEGGDDEAAVAFWRKANEKLSEQGISTLPLHPRLRSLLPQEELEAYDASIGQ